MTPFAFRPSLEELTARLVPSTTAVIPPTAPAAAQVASLPSHPYAGQGQGQYTQPVTPDVGVTRQFTGRLKLTGFGEFLATGWVQGPGLVQNGRATGKLTLIDYKGTITIELHSRPLSAFSPIPSELVYSIVGGTGAYANTKGYGVAAFTFTPGPATPGHATAGNYVLKFT